MHTLFEKYQLGNLTLKNRFVMAPMTRCRSFDNIPSHLVVEYYRQRAGAGLIITEGTSPSPNGLGYPRIPGAFTDVQIEGWKKVATAVHEEGGKIFVQIMHTGRISGKINLPQGTQTIAPSAIQAAGEIFSETGMVAHDKPKAMTLEEIQQTQDDYVLAAKRLVEEAGVDGVEFHAANGYLLNQFINPKSNQRNDAYGGSIENRIRFVVETVQKAAKVIGGEKIGIRISPFGIYNDMLGDYASVEDTYITLTQELKMLNLAYIHIVSQMASMGNLEGGSVREIALRKAIKNTFEGTVISGGDINNITSAEAILNDGFDLVYVGRPYISNPDFAKRMQYNIPLTDANPDTFFAPTKEGYIDYTFAETLAKK